jgi:hypothetical protein
MCIAMKRRAAGRFSAYVFDNLLGESYPVAACGRRTAIARLPLFQRLAAE